jgi:hypothetical protein
MLGRLEMNVDECITAYTDLAENVFCQKKSRLPFSRKGKVKAQFDSLKLEKAIQDTLKKASISETALLNDGTERGCRTQVPQWYEKDVILTILALFVLLTRIPKVSSASEAIPYPMSRASKQPYAKLRLRRLLLPHFLIPSPSEIERSPMVG